MAQRLWFGLVLCSLTLAAAASAQEATSATPAPAPVAEALAVLPVTQDAGLTAKEASYLSDAVRGAAANASKDRFSLVPQKDVAKALGKRAGKCDEACAAEAGSKLLAARVLLVEIARLDGQLRASVKLLRCEGAALERMERASGEAVTALEGPLAEAVAKALAPVEEKPPVATAQPAPQPAEESKPSVDAPAPKGEEIDPASDSLPIVAIARLQDVTSPGIDAERLAALDDLLWSELSSRQVPGRYRLLRLSSRDKLCDQFCAQNEANDRGAKFVLWSMVRYTNERLFIVGTVFVTDDRRSLNFKTSKMVTSESELETCVSAIALHFSQVLFSNASTEAPLRKRTRTSSAMPRPDRELNGDFGDPGTRGQGSDSPESADSEFARRHRSRNTGVGVFVVGVILDLGGAGVFGAGLGVGELGLIIPGAAGMGVGTIFLASGLGVWVSNQVKMNKIERGIPLSRRLKLEGLSPVVASREGAAPGLNAAFSF